MTARAIGVSLFTTMWLAGCMVGPDYVSPETATPATFGELRPQAPPQPAHSEAVAEGTPTGWWVSFGDEQLTAIVARAVEANPTLQQAEARVREARASDQIAAADLWPQIGASGSFTRVRTSKNGPGALKPGHWYDLFFAGFDANWELDVFGGNRRAVEAADASLEATERDRDAVLVSLLGEVGLEYVTYRSLQQRIALTERNLDAQQKTLELTQRLFGAGLAPELDVQRAAAQVATTAAAIPPLEEQAAQALHGLAVLTGAMPMVLAPELAETKPIPKPPPQVAVGLPSELLLRRPDVARAERQLASQTAEIGVATRDLFPRFFLSGLGGLQSIKSKDFFEWESLATSFGPSVTWPIFQGGRIKANIAFQTEAQQELLAAYREAVLVAFQDVEDALVAFSRQQAARDRLADAVTANKRASELARNLYAQGLTDFLTVLV
ncbi:MAG TPA: efflux transporter outer membrane subunit, partial [Myxococcota bacterium]|nr:efflux transporter outer membrane subunit [Myxococcota bacterium]